MSTPQQGAVAPYQGQAVSPSAMTDPQSAAAHSMTGVLSRLVRDSGVFRNEAEVLSAISTVEGFFKHLIDPGQRQAVKREHDIAPVEDVTQRTPPANAAAMPQPVPNSRIDYAELARYIVAAQRAASDQGEVHEITDAPEKKENPPAEDSGSNGF